VQKFSFLCVAHIDRLQFTASKSYFLGKQRKLASADSHY